MMRHIICSRSAIFLHFTQKKLVRNTVYAFKQGYLDKSPLYGTPPEAAAPFAGDYYSTQEAQTLAKAYNQSRC
jgi:hypothetical protein